MPQQQHNHILTNQEQSITIDSTYFVMADAKNSDSLLLGFDSTNQFSSNYSPNTSPPLPFATKNKNNDFGLFLTYFGILGIWLIYYQLNNKTITNIWQSFFSDNSLNKLIEDRRSYNKLASLFMFLTGLIIISIFTFQFVNSMEQSVTWLSITVSSGSILIIFGILTIGFFLKSMFLWVSAFAFNSYKPFNTYLTLSVTSIQFLGLILLPLVILSTYTHSIQPIWITKFGLVLILIAFIYRLLRAFFLGVKQTNSHVLHIILYICALEILPLFVLIKLLG